MRARMVAEQRQNGQQNTHKNGGSIGARMVANRSRMISGWCQNAGKNGSGIEARMVAE